MSSGLSNLNPISLLRPEREGRVTTLTTYKKKDVFVSGIKAIHPGKLIHNDPHVDWITLLSRIGARKDARRVTLGKKTRHPITIHAK